MGKLIPTILLVAFAITTVSYPVIVWYQTSTLTLDSSFFFSIFPVLGLIAFTIMWLHIVGGAFEDILNRYIDFDKFLYITSYIVLILIILHPLLFILSIYPNLSNIFNYGPSLYIWLGIIGWLMLITYDIRKAFRKRQFFIRHWGIIQFLITLGFYVIFFHSLGLGHNLQSGTLRVIWIIYGITAFLATLYTYGIKTWLHRD